MAMFNSYVSLPEGNSHPPRWIYANIHLIYNAVIRSHLFLSVSRPIVLTFLGIAALFLIRDVTRKSRQATPKVVLEAVERPEAAGNPGNHRLNWHGEDGEDGGMLGVECWELGNWDTFRVEELTFGQKLWSVIWSPQQSFCHSYGQPLSSAGHPISCFCYLLWIQLWTLKSPSGTN